MYRELYSYSFVNIIMIHAHKINSHEVNSHQINFPRDQLP